MVKNILEYLEYWAERVPEKIAFSDVNQLVTYEQLAKKGKQIGSYIVQRGGGQTERPVIVFIERSIQCIEAFMGVVYSGNFYVPVDRKLPIKRIQQIIDNMNPLFLMTWEQDKELLQNLNYECEALLFHETETAEIESFLLNQIRERCLDTNPLYTIFTSGSTGIPKGVVVCHRSVIDLVEQFSKTFDFSEQEVFANQAPFDFDVSVKDIYSTLKNGAAMVIVPQEMFMLPKKLIAYLNEKKVTTMIWAVSALSVIFQLKALKKEVPMFVKKIMFSGEVMPVKVLNYWKEHLPQAMYVNLYGPTEITCNCTYYIIDREYEQREALPIGIPFSNTEIILLNEKNQMAEKGEAGEICVRGTSLALGYYNNPEATKKAFCFNPLNTNYPEIIYRTGDMGKYNEEGQLVFLSRQDSQIKHMGHRIELGEIEIVLNSLDYIGRCCCIYHKEKEKIVMFYESEEPCQEKIIKDLYQYLPKYMCPNRYIHLPNMPVNKNGKIDRRYLKENMLV